MNESIPQNELPINQVCKEKLLQAKVTINPSHLYLLQLVQYGVQELDLKQIDPNLPYKMDSEMGRLVEFPPEKVMARFYPESSQADDAAATMKDMNPLEAAESLIQDLAMERDLV